MIQAIALDTDRSALTILDTYCQRVNGITLSRTFVKPSEARRHLQLNRVNLVFLEAYLSGESGIDFWLALRQEAAETPGNQLPQLVFTTSQSKYAQVSYELQALDYLLKPFSFERFSQTVQRATDQLSQHLSATEPSATYRSFRVDYGWVTINLIDITHVEALGNYCKLYFVSQRPLVVRMTMKALYQELIPLNFMQVHRSYIVALRRIRAIHNKQIFLDEKQVPLGTYYERMVYGHFENLSHSSQ